MKNDIRFVCLTIFTLLLRGENGEEFVTHRNPAQLETEISNSQCSNISIKREDLGKVNALQIRRIKGYTKHLIKLSTSFSYDFIYTLN